MDKTTKKIENKFSELLQTLLKREVVE